MEKKKKIMIVVAGIVVIIMAVTFVFDFIKQEPAGGTGEWAITPTEGLTPIESPTTTVALTPTIVIMPSNTVIPTSEPVITAIPTVTKIPQENCSPTVTETPVPTAANTPTAVPLPTSTPSPTPKYTFQSVEQTMYVTGSVNVRNFPSTEGEKIGSLAKNTEVYVLSECVETGWYEFEYEGKMGYASNNYFTVVKPVPTSTPKPTSTPTPTPTPTPMPTPMPTAIPTVTPIIASTITPKPTSTPKPSNTPVPTFIPEDSGYTELVGEWQCGENIVASLWWNGETDYDDMRCILEFEGTGEMWVYSKMKEVYGKNFPWRSTEFEYDYDGYIYEVFFSEGITCIQKFGVAGMKLEKVSFPSTLKEIGANAFDFANRLTEISLPEGLEVIGNNVFDRCEGLTALVLPSTVTYIGDAAFGIVTSVTVQENHLTKVIIPASVEYMGYAVFRARTGIVICMEGEENSSKNFDADWNYNAREKYHEVIYNYSE